MNAPTVRAAASWPDRPAIVVPDLGTVWTFSELEQQVQAAAAVLAANKVRLGSMVGLLGENSVAWIVAHLALARLGAVSLPLNFRLADAELRWQLERSGAGIVLSDGPLRDLGPAEVWPLADLALRGRHDAGDPGGNTAQRRDAPHTVFFTSGTTGKPKGVVRTWGQQLASARAVNSGLGLSPLDSWLLCLPLFHVGGLAIVHRMLACGGAVVLLPRFASGPVGRAIAAHRPTRISLTATMARQLLAENPAILHRARTVLLGGEAIGADLLALPRGVASYGLTEAGSTVAVAAPGTTLLHPLPGFEVKVEDDDGTPCPVGQQGCIAIRGPALMTGYLGGEAIADGWFDTGDLGLLAPGGGFTVLARREDLILSGGENVYPAEVEAVLLEHPDVAAAAVTAIPDERWGQVPVAAVVTRLGSLDASELASFTRSHLASYKVPRRFLEVPALPVRPSGKLDRQAVAALFEADLGGPNAN